MKKIRLRFFIIILSIHFLLPFAAIAGYIGPITVVEGGWGKADNEFGFMSGDTSDSFPGEIKVNILGNIFLVDGVNRCVKIYNIGGTLISKIEPQNIVVLFGWPGFMECDSKNNIYTSNYDKKLQKYNLNGELLWEKEVFVGSIDVISDNSLIIYGYREGKKGIEKYLNFSPNGQLIKSWNKKPFILGNIKERSLGGGRYKVTIKYPDLTYELNKGPYRNYIRGCDGIINAISFKSIERFNTSGEVIDKLIIPKDQKNIIRPAGGGFEERSELIVEYGKAVLAPSGNIYTWKRTPDKYSIIKWIYIDTNKKIPSDILKQFNKEQFRILRNEIFARKGRIFKSKDLQEIFSQQPWYKPDPKYSDEKLIPLDRENISLILKFEKSARE